MLSEQSESQPYPGMARHEKFSLGQRRTKNVSIVSKNFRGSTTNSHTTLRPSSSWRGNKNIPTYPLRPCTRPRHPKITPLSSKGLLGGFGGKQSVSRDSRVAAVVRNGPIFTVVGDLSHLTTGWVRAPIGWYFSCDGWILFPPATNRFSDREDF